MVLKIIATFVIGVLLSGVIFALLMVLQPILSKTKSVFITHNAMPIISIIFILIMYFVLPVTFNAFNFKGLSNMSAWIVMLLTAVTVAFMISKKGERLSKLPTDISMIIMNGFMMEICQRLFMQVLLITLLQMFGISNYKLWSIILNAMVWCVGIAIQEAIARKKFDKEFWLDITCSLMFSIGIGYVLVESGCIFLTMIGHGLERLLSNIFRKFNFAQK